MERNEKIYFSYYIPYLFTVGLPMISSVHLCCSSAPGWDGRVPLQPSDAVASQRLSAGEMGTGSMGGTGEAGAQFTICTYMLNIIRAL